jgi:hypothetical protein
MSPQYLFGMKVYVVPDKPIYRTLSREVSVTPEFREYVNKWMAEFFKPIGFGNDIPDGEVQGSLSCMWMNPRTWEKVKAASAQVRLDSRRAPWDDALSFFQSH